MDNSSHYDNPSSPTIFASGNHTENNWYQRWNDSRPPPQLPDPPRYGWVYIPPPGHASQQQRPPPAYPYWTGQRPSGQISPNQAQSRPNSGVLGPRPRHHFVKNAAIFTGPETFRSQTLPDPISPNVFPSAIDHSSIHTEQPPWGWFNADQPTSLPQLFNTFSLNDPGNDGWVMDTGATDHVHSDSGILHSILNNHGNRSNLVGDGSAIPVTTTGYTFLLNPYRPLHLNHVLITPNIIKKSYFCT